MRLLRWHLRHAIETLICHAPFNHTLSSSGLCPGRFGCGYTTGASSLVPRLACALLLESPEHISYNLIYLSDHSKDSWFSLPSAADIVSAPGLWHKQALKNSCMKYRFAAFLRCLGTAAVLAHAKKFTFLPPFYPTRYTR